MKTGLVQPANIGFFAFLTQISDRHLLAALRRATGSYPSICGVGDAGNRKFQMNLVQTGLVHAANVHFFTFLARISDQRWLSAFRGAAGRFPSILGVGDAGNLRFVVIPLKTDVFNRRMSIFLAIKILISDWHPLGAPKEAAGGFPTIFGVEDAWKLKFRVDLVPNPLVHPANVGFFRVFDPDILSARNTSS